MSVGVADIIYSLLIYFNFVAKATIYRDKICLEPKVFNNQSMSGD